MTTENINALVESEAAQLKKMQQLVEESMKTESLISHDLFKEDYNKLAFGERLSDKVAEFVGSWKFITVFILFIVLWMALNVFWLLNKGFDPYPFILLNLILSCVAAIQAPLIMMSQNRQEQKDRLRSENDYMINMKAEIEIRNLHKKMDLLIVDQMKTLLEIQKLQLEYLEKIEKKVNP